MKSTLLLVLSAAFAQAQTLSQLDPATANRSGLVILKGASLGTSGVVTIDGLPAPVSSWTAAEIAAYVPETAHLGQVGVSVSTGGVSSNQMILTVTDRVASGRIKWRFRMDAPYSSVRPARAADGTVYVVDVYSRLYSVSSAGALNWVRSAGNKGLALGPDGTVYTASESNVRAFSADGTLKWTFVQSPPAFNMQGIATDATGNVYGVATNGIGIFSLTPGGRLRWQTQELYVRPIVSYSEIAISPNNDQLYFYANHHTLGVRTSDGAIVASFPAYSQPVVSPFDGSVHILWSAYTPFAQQLWGYPNGVTYSLPEVDSSGSHYHVAGGPTGWEMVSLSPAGALQWRLTMPKSVGPPDVDPTRSIAIVAGSNTLDIPGFIQGVSIASHAVVWNRHWQLRSRRSSTASRERMASTNSRTRGRSFPRTEKRRIW